MSDPPTPPPEAMLSDLDVRRIARAVCDEMAERERSALEKNVQAGLVLLSKHRDLWDHSGHWNPEALAPLRRATEVEMERFGRSDRQRPPERPEPPPATLAFMTRRAYEEVTGRTAPDMFDADWLQDVHARHVLDRWRDLGRPDPTEFLRQVALIARAARESDELMFATHIRGIRADGQRCSADRSRDLGAVLRTRPASGSGGATWDERLRAAGRWSQRSESSGSPVQALAEPPDRESSWVWEKGGPWRRISEEERAEALPVGSGQRSLGFKEPPSGVTSTTSDGPSDLDLTPSQ